MSPGAASSLALAALVSIAVLAPWASGAVEPAALRLVVVVGLVAAAAALALGAARRGVPLPAVPLWPWAGFLGLALVQLAPLPEPLHRLLAPGSWAVWHPANAAARAVLGEGPHPLSVDPRTTAAAAALLAGLTLLALLAAPALSRPRSAVAALAAVALGGFALASYAILARARFGALLYGSVAVPTVSPFGPFVNKNHFAGWAAMAALLAAGLATGLGAEARARGSDWTAGRRAAAVVLVWVAAVTLVLAVLASLSRGGALALAAGALALIGLVLARRRRSSRCVLLPLLAAAVLVALALAAAPPASRERLRSLSGASFRLDTWRDSLRLAAASPLLGHGLGAFHDAYPRFKSGHATVRVEHAESEYLETLAETGAAGLLLALASLVALLSAGGLPRAQGGALARGTARGGLAALVALAVHSLFDFDLRIPSNAALAALAAAAAVSVAGRGCRRLPPVASAGLALAVLGLVPLAVRPPEERARRAREHSRRAAAAVSEPQRGLRMARAEASLVQLLRERPAHAESWLMLAGVRRALGEVDDCRALAAHALWLEPRRPELREAAERLARAQRP